MPKVIDRHSATVLFLALFLLPAFILIGVSVNIYQNKFAIEKALTVQGASKQVVGDLMVIENTFRLISGDLFLIASHDGISRILAGHARPHDIQEIETEFTALARYKGIYDQVRLIGADGWERLRIDYKDGKIKTVEKGGLQYKGERYYFRDTMKLKRHHVYFSPFDLNIEHGEIERPYKPMIRIAMPIVGANGKALGIVILNYLGRNILKGLGKASGDGEIMLLNNEGYWLKGLKPGDEWGFMFPDGTKKTMAVRYPNVWAAMQRSPEGDIFTPKGFFSFCRVYPMQDFHPPGIQLASPRHAYYWFITDFIPRSRLFQESNKLYWELLWRTLIALSAWGVMAAFLASSVQRRRLIEEQLNETDAFYQEVLNNTSDGIVAVNSDGIVQSFNLAAGRIFGYHQEEVIHRHVAMLIPREYRDLHLKHIMALKDDGAQAVKQQLEVAGLRKDGTVFPMEASIGINRKKGTCMFTVVFRDITKPKQMREQLQRMATHDALTGTYNRYSLKERLERECARASRYGRPLSLLMLDIDEFKSINDRYGHDAGDAYLVAFTKLLMQACRETDSIFRYGGEEFLIVLPETDAEHAKQLAHRLIDEVRKLQIKVDNQVISTTVSIGAALFDGVATADPEALLKLADQAVYEAKDSGRNCFRSV